MTEWYDGTLAMQVKIYTLLGKQSERVIRAPYPLSQAIPSALETANPVTCAAALLPPFDESVSNGASHRGRGLQSQTRRPAKIRSGSA